MSSDEKEVQSKYQEVLNKLGWTTPSNNFIWNRNLSVARAEGILARIKNCEITKEDAREREELMYIYFSMIHNLVFSNNGDGYVQNREYLLERISYLLSCMETEEERNKVYIQLQNRYKAPPLNSVNRVKLSPVFQIGLSDEVEKFIGTL
jgi:hypothetical protein